MVHMIGPSLQGQWQNCGKSGRLFPTDIPGRDSVVVTARRLRTINTGAPFDHVEVQLQNALLAEDQFGHWYKRELGALAQDRAAGSEEQVFYQLLRERGPSVNALDFQISLRSDFDRLPIESVVLVEARVFRRDHGMLEVGRDSAQRNEFVSFLIRFVVDPGLQAALHVHRGRRRIDPARSHKNEHAKRPKKRDSDEKPSNEGTQGSCARWGLGVCVWIFWHSPE